MIHEQASAKSNQSNWFTIALVVLLLLIFRFSILYVDRANLEQDPDSYVLLAENLAATGTFGFVQPDGEVQPTAYRPVFFPWLISWLVVDGQLSRWWVGFFQVVLSLGSGALLFSIGKKLGAPYAIIAAVALVLDPLMLRQSQLIMTETLTSFLVLLAWRTWLGCVNVSSDSSENETKVKWLQCAALGIVMGIAVLTRPTNAPWVLLCTLALLFTLAETVKTRLLKVSLVCVCVAIFVIPWMVRNQQRMGKPMWATSHGGYTLMLANNPLLQEHFDNNGPSRNWDAEPFHRAWKDRQRIFADASDNQLLDPDYWRTKPSEQQTPQTLGELEDDALAYRIATKTIQDQPAKFVRSAVYRLGWFWAAWPNVSGIASLAIGGWYLTIYALAAWGIGKALLERREGMAVRKKLLAWLPALLVILVLSGIHSIYWSNMRMRTPLMGSVYLFALGWGLKPEYRSWSEERGNSD